MCGEGKQTRVKICDIKNCKPQTEIKICQMNPCSTGLYKAINLTNLFTSFWSEWSTWSPCSKPCGVGYHHRVRNCKSKKISLCVGERYQYKHCSIMLCDCEYILKKLPCFALDISSFNYSL
jgi:hypothetical protein